MKWEYWWKYCHRKQEVLREKHVPECRNASWFLTFLGTASVNTVHPGTQYNRAFTGA